METKITREKFLTIQSNMAMKEFAITEEQRLRWVELLTTDFPIYRKDGNPAIAKNGKPIMKRKTFEGARLKFFEEFYGFGKEQRQIEKEALALFLGSEEQEAATV